MTTCRCCALPMRANGAAPDGRVTKRHHSRGLCDRCRRRADESGTLDNWPRTNLSAEHVLAEWAELRGLGLNVRQAAGRIGMHPAALDRALRRATARGDLRGQRVAS